MSTSDKLIKEMFKRVGLNYSLKEIEKFAEQKEWFKLKSWSEEEEDDYKAWGIKLLMKEKNWIEIEAKRNIQWFLLDIGWTTKSE